MTCYMISQDGEQVALVADLEMARSIVRCRPWGEYLVELVEVEGPEEGDPSPSRKPPIDLRLVRRRRPAPQPVRWDYGPPPVSFIGAQHQAR